MNLTTLPPSDDPWRGVRLTGLMVAISCLVFISITLLTVLGAMHLFGIDPNSGVNPRDEPMLAAAFVLAAFVYVSVFITLSCVLASWVAMKRFTRSEVRSEYLRLMWLPKAGTLNGKIFDALFKPSDGSVESR